MHGIYEVQYRRQLSKKKKKKLNIFKPVENQPGLKLQMIWLTPKIFKMLKKHETGLLLRKLVTGGCRGNCLKCAAGWALGHISATDIFTA
jgi:hypothetical protein